MWNRLANSVREELTLSSRVFVLRIAHGGSDLFQEALAAGQLIIGWAEAKGLLDPGLDSDQFREIIRTRYHYNETNLRRAGAAAGHMWRFIREMDGGDRI